MLLLFKSGWIHMGVGAVLLLGALLSLDHIQGREPFACYSFLERPPRIESNLVYWVSVGAVGGVGIYFGLTLLGSLLLPLHFPRWWFSALHRIYGRTGLIRCMALALMAALLFEPLFRLGLQPPLRLEFGLYPTLLILAAAITLVSWAPGARPLILAVFVESMWYGWLFEQTLNPYVPVLGHGLAELLLALWVWGLEKQGLTHIPPPLPRMLQTSR